MDETSLQFHIEANDYFGTLATVLDLVRQDLARRGYNPHAGLVRDSLQFKRNMLTETIKEGVVGRLLKIINSILGSLSSVFPFLEAVKEYKEHVESAIAVQNRW